MKNGRSIKVLVVEGDNDTRTFVRFSFTACGDFDLEFCASELEALRTVIEFSPDFVILDVSLAEASSRLTLQALRKLPEMEKVTIILVTASRLQSEIDRLFKLGASDVMTRRCDPFAIPTQVIRTCEQAYA